MTHSWQTTKMPQSTCRLLQEKYDFRQRLLHAEESLKYLTHRLVAVVVLVGGECPQKKGAQGALTGREVKKRWAIYRAIEWILYSSVVWQASGPNCLLLVIEWDDWNTFIFILLNFNSWNQVNHERVWYYNYIISGPTDFWKAFFLGQMVKYLNTLDVSHTFLNPFWKTCLPGTLSLLGKGDFGLSNSIFFILTSMSFVEQIFFMPVFSRSLKTSSNCGITSKWTKRIAWLYGSFRWRPSPLDISFESSSIRFLRFKGAGTVVLCPGRTVSAKALDAVRKPLKFTSYTFPVFCAWLWCAHYCVRKIEATKAFFGKVVFLGKHLARLVSSGISSEHLTLYHSTEFPWLGLSFP